MYSIGKHTTGFNSCIEKSPQLGAQHGDTKKFDDLDELKNFASSPLECRIIKIRLYHGSLMPTGVVNGIQLVYKNLDNGKVYETTKRFGTHQFIGDTVFELSPEELIVNAKVRSGQIVDYLEFQTNLNRIIAKGGRGGSERPYPFNGKVVVGMHGGYGGHLHNIGFYLAPREELNYWKKRPYILIKKKLEQNKDILYQYVSDLQEGKNPSKNSSGIGGLVMSLLPGGHASKLKKSKNTPEIALALLILQGDQTFRLVMSFV